MTSAPVSRLALAALLASVAAACALPDGPGRMIGRVTDRRAREPSGLAAASARPGVFWTHDDSGAPARIFAIERTGRVLGMVEVEGARNRDWEDVAADGAGHLWIADTGNNGGRRRTLTLYRVVEPDPLSPPARVAVDRTVRVRYGPGEDAPRYDAEALLVLAGRLHILTKQPGRARVFRVPDGAGDGATVVLEARGEIEFEDVPTRYGSGVTAADASPDGRRLAALTYGAVLVFDVRDDGALSPRPVAKVRLVPERTGQAEGLAWTREGLVLIAEDGRLFGLAVP
jgi:hypothetical protein